MIIREAMPVNRKDNDQEDTCTENGLSNTAKANPDKPPKGHVYISFLC